MRYIAVTRRSEAPLRCFLVAAVGAGIALRFVRLGGQSLWVDEAITLKNSYIGEGGIVSHFFNTLQGPLVSLLMHFWGSLSTNDAFMRIPFAVAGALSVAALYLLARSVYDSWASLHTVFLAALSPILIWYSQEIRGYSFVVLFAILATYFFIQWLSRPTPRNGLFYGIFLFAGLVSNLSAGFVAASHLVYLVATAGKRRLMGKWIVVVFVVLLVFSPWVRQMIERSLPDHAEARSAEPLMGGGGLSILGVPYMYFTYAVGYTLGPSVRELQADRAGAVSENVGWLLAAVVTFGIPVAVGIARLATSNRSLLVLLLTWLVVPVAAVSVVAALSFKAFTARYGLVAAPALILLAGQGLAVISRTRFWPFVGLVVVLLGASIYNYLAVPAYGKDDARQAARIIKSGFVSGDSVVAVYAAEPLEHYLKGFAPVSVFGANHVVSDEAMRSRCGEIAAASERVWLSLCRERVVDRRGTIKAWFDRNMEMVSSARLTGVNLYLYKKRSG